MLATMETTLDWESKIWGFVLFLSLSSVRNFISHEDECDQNLSFLLTWWHSEAPGKKEKKKVTHKTFFNNLEFSIPLGIFNSQIEESEKPHVERKKKGRKEGEKQVRQVVIDHYPSCKELGEKYGYILCLFDSWLRESLVSQGHWVSLLVYHRVLEVYLYSN
jgi:hypothetical protein